ncbi:hypothetical protein [Sphaerisporangium rhizosphaerae]|uniref:Uncharacterized protein n=1 Tax=Sphaerisporangium rhizosphaerae TaxID=2269375 RepID=A0ABW2PJ10_9ACTN
MDETERLKSLIFHTAQELWDEKEALRKFLGVVRRSDAFADLADALEKMPVKPANATFYGVRSREFQG